MEVLFKYCEKGSGDFNEDALLVTPKFACVIDGATDVFFDRHPQLKGIVYKYVFELINSLKNACKDEKSLKDIVKESINEIYPFFNDKFGLDLYEEYELPTFSIACVKENKDNYEYLVLGDCFLLFKRDEQIWLIEDERVKFFSRNNREEMKRLKLDPRSDEKSIKIYQSTRMKANSKLGYPIGSVKGTGIDDSLYGIVAKKSVNRILLFSDGFIDYFTNANVEYEQLFDETHLKYIVDKAYDFYNDNESYMEQLRPKQFDDRTIVLLKKEEDKYGF